MKPDKKQGKRLKKVMFVGDLHAPYEDKRAVNLVLRVGEAWKPDVLAMLGDFSDFYSVSDHLKDPARAGRLRWELEQSNLLLDRFDALGATRKIFVAGNHEDRYDRYLQRQAPELHGVVDIPGALRLRQRRWEYVPYRDHTRLGKLYLTHDVGVAGRNAVFRCLEAYEHSVLTGHTHRLAYIVEGNAAGEYKVSAQFGWLGDVNKIDYMHRVQAKKNWALGFGIGYLDEDTGIVYVTPVPIVRYTCVVEGKLYKA